MDTAQLDDAMETGPDDADMYVDKRLLSSPHASNHPGTSIMAGPQRLTAPP